MAGRSLLRIALPPVLTLVGSMVVAQVILMALGTPEYLVPRPLSVLVEGWKHRGPLLAATLVSAGEALGGFAMAGVLGVLLAIALTSSRWVERAIYPYTVFFQTVPIIAIAPLLVFWFGAGAMTVAIAAFIVAVFPVIANTFNGLRSTDPALRDLFRLYGAGWFSGLVKLRLPSALPNIMTGLRVAAGLAVIGTIVGEFVAGSGTMGGLGITVMVTLKDWNTPLLFAAILMSSLLGLALFGAVNGVSYLVLRRWHASAQDV